MALTIGKTAHGGTDNSYAAGILVATKGYSLSTAGYFSKLTPYVDCGAGVKLSGFVCSTTGSAPSAILGRTVEVTTTGSGRREVDLAFASNLYVPAQTIHLVLWADADPKFVYDAGISGDSMYKTGQTYSSVSAPTVSGAWTNDPPNYTYFGTYSLVTSLLLEQRRGSRSVLLTL